MTIADEYQDLDERLAEEIDYDTPPESFTDDDRANRLLRVHASLARDLADVAQVYDAERNRLDDWRDDRTEQIRNRVEWVEQALEMWHRSKLQANPKAVTVTLPNGQHRARAQQPEWTVDPDLFLPWAETHGHPELIRVKTIIEPDKAAAKKLLHVDADTTTPEGETVRAVTEDGEIVPGVSVVIRGRKHEVVR